MVNKTAFGTRMHRALFAAARIALVLALLSGGAISTSAAPAPGPASSQRPEQTTPSHFIIENVGQFAAEAKFLLKQGDRRLWLTGNSLWLTVPDALPGDVRFDLVGRRAGQVGLQRDPAAVSRPGTAIRFTFAGANGTPTIEPYGRVATNVSYLLGSDPAAWRQNVPVWTGIRYRDLYPGIDLVIGDGGTGAMPWRLEAQPGADRIPVTLRVEGVETATEGGSLRLLLKGQTLDLALPAWSVAGQVGPVASAAGKAADGALVLTPGAEPAAAAPAGSPAGIDAGDLIYNTTISGSAYDAGYAIAADGLGNTYITGATLSANLPVTAGAYDAANNSAVDLADAFVAKYGPTGNGPLYLTYLGGTGDDIGWGIAVSGNLAFVAGETNSTNFPGMTEAVEVTDGFVASLNANGTGIRYVSRMGGADYDAAYAIAVSGLEAYTTGITRSDSVCAYSASGDLIVRKLNSVGGPAYTTCLSWPNTEAGYAIAVRNGEAYVTGETLAGNRDLLAARFDANGIVSTGTQLGGTGDDWGKGVAVDSAGFTYVTGTSGSTDFPLSGGGAGWGGGLTDAIVVKLAPDFAAYFATYLGGDGNDTGYGIAVDTVQALYVTGTTTSAVFPMTAGAYATAPFGGTDVYVARIHPTGTSASADKVTYSTYLGTAGDDLAYGIATDTGGQAYVTGSNTANPDELNTTNSFLAKIKVSTPPGPPNVSASASGISVLLTWGATTPVSSKYQVFRSTEPYFKPGDWSSTLRVEQTTRSYTDVNVLSTVGAYFYVVKGLDATPAGGPNSNRTGKFTYPLVKGTP